MQGAGQLGELVPHRERSATQRILGNNLAPCDQDGIAARLRMEAVLSELVCACHARRGNVSCPLIASLQGGASLAGSAMP